MLVIDTHAVAWLALDSGRLSARAHAAVLRARQDEGGLAVADITLLELATLAARGRLELGTGTEDFLRTVESNFAVLPITSRICALALALPGNYPNDPADRLIGATALAHGAPLLTIDRGIRKSKALETIW